MNFLQKFAMVVVSILLFLAGAETALRWFDSEAFTRHKRKPQGIFCKPDKLLGWLGIPNVSGAMRPSSHAQDMENMAVNMNGEGFFDISHTVSKPEGVKRLLFLGDSFTAGIGIPKKDRFTDLVYDGLSSDHEVLNMGIWGYSTGQELLVFKEKGLKYSPDIVVLCMFVDDLFCGHLFSVNEGTYIKPKFAISHDDLQLRNVPVGNNHSSSALWNMLLTRYYKLRNRIEMGTEYAERGWLSVFDKTYLHNDRYYLCLRLLGEIANLAKACGARFLVVCIPWKEQIVEEHIRRNGQPYAGIPLDRLDLGLPQRIVAQYCRQLGIPVLDLLPVFKKHSLSEKLFFEKDLHWTKAGHRLAATKILEHLKKLDYL